MISMIVGLVFCAICILVIVVSIIDGGDDGIVVGVGFLLGVLVVVGLSHGTGYKSFSPNLEAKAYIETALETNPSLYIIEKAEHYNKDIDFGNNFWCRFNVEDRSDYYIDIGSYLAKAN